MSWAELKLQKPRVTESVTEEGKPPSSAGRCARQWEPQSCVASTVMYHILSMKQSVTARNQYQDRQMGKGMDNVMIVLIVCLQDHDDQRRGWQTCRLGDVRRRE